MVVNYAAENFSGDVELACGILMEVFVLLEQVLQHARKHVALMLAAIAKLYIARTLKASGAT